MDIDVDAVGRGDSWLSLGAKTLANEGEDTGCAGRGEGFVGICGLGRFAAADADDSAIPAGVESTNLRFLDDGGGGI